MKERHQPEFVEMFYGQSTSYDVAIDFSRKAGPLARMTQILNKESAKFENGGSGQPGEKLIAPSKVRVDGPTASQLAAAAGAAAGRAGSEPGARADAGGADGTAADDRERPLARNLHRPWNGWKVQPEIK